MHALRAEAPGVMHRFQCPGADNFLALLFILQYYAEFNVMWAATTFTVCCFNTVFHEVKVEHFHSAVCHLLCNVIA